MKIYSTRESLKIFYFLISSDGQVDEDEIKTFYQLGKSLDVLNFLDYKDYVIGECQNKIAYSSYKPERESIIFDFIAEAMRQEASPNDQGLTPRLLLWDLFACAFSNRGYDESEKRIIEFVANNAGIERSVVLEMEQIMKTAISIQKERDWVLSRKETDDIDDLLNELDKRMQVIEIQAKALISDEIDADNPYEYKPDFFDKTKSKVDEKMKPITDKVNDTVSPVKMMVGNNTKKVANLATKKGGKLLEKISGRFNSSDDKTKEDM